MAWFDAFIVVFASGMRLAVPLILACLAGLWSERSGVVDIGLEGKILVGAFGSALGATFTGSGGAKLGILARSSSATRRASTPSRITCGRMNMMSSSR